jgi:ankyrin repeat protein
MTLKALSPNDAMKKNKEKVDKWKTEQALKRKKEEMEAKRRPLQRSPPPQKAGLGEPAVKGTEKAKSPFSRSEPLAEPIMKTATVQYPDKELFQAAKKGNPDNIRAALKSGADVNARDKNGLTPLMHAAKTGKERAVEILISEGADSTSVDNFGMGAISRAASSGSPTIIAHLIQKGADIEFVDGEGLTPLIRAVRKGKRQAVELLIDKEANADVLDEKGTPLLSWAVVNGTREIVRILLQCGKADPNIRDNYGVTPLMVAVQDKYNPLADELILHGADVNAKDILGKNVMGYAVDSGGYGTMTDLLISHGAKE